jgi:hypothetical protein
MSQDTQDSAKMIGRMDRFETSLGIKIDHLASLQQELSELKTALTLEVDELKTLKLSLEKTLPETVDQSLRTSAERIIPQLLPPLVEGFQEENLDFINTSIEDAQQVKEGIDKSLSQARSLMSAFKKTITLRGVGITLAFCLGSLLTAGGIYYFFPQHISITYGLAPSAARMVVLGEAFMENTDKLSRGQKDFFMLKAVEKLKNPVFPKD